MTDLGSGDARIRELMRELSELRDRHETVARVFQDLARSHMRLQPILDQIAEAMTSLLRSEYSLIHLTEGELLHFQAHAGVPAAAVEYERLHPVGPGVETLTGRVALTKQPVHIRDAATDADYNFPAVKLAPVRTLLGAPVLIEDELVGVMQVGRRDVRPFDDGEIELIATFANQCAIAIGNARLFETVERQRAHLERFVSPEVAALVSTKEGSRLLAGHRAYISVAYFDLRGFTAFVETAEPEELIDVVREYHEAAGQLVAAHKGTLEHFAGDGLMVFFNDPGLGAGIATGHATLGQIGFEGRHDYGVLGPVTNLAARLSDAAAAGQILLSQRAFSALEDSVEAQPAVQLEIRGFSRPVPVYELLRVVET